jgi:aryl-alcohol dehydrogenase-like predicted oxidoreductase
MRRASSVHPIAALQSEYSLWTRDPEGEILTTARELGIGFVAYSPLGRAFLTGTLRAVEGLDANDVRRRFPRWQGENLSKNLKLVEQLSEMAREIGCTTAQLALAWVRAQGEDIIPIPGARRRKHLEENAAAVDITLTPEHLARLDAIAPRGAAAGPRFPSNLMRLVDR